MTQEVQNRRQESQRGQHARGRADGHHTAQAGDALVFRQHQAAKSDDRRQRRYEDCFAGALGQDARLSFLGIAIENMDAAGHADADDQRQRHDVRRIERNVEPPHEPNHPDGADGDRQE